MTPADLESDPGGLAAPPIVVLSDLHLGHPATYVTEPALILPLLEGARTAVFNGDTCELLSLRNRVEGRRKLARLAELCIENGVRPIFLTGNHDPLVSTAHHLDLFGGKVFITHGDALHPWLAPWARDAAFLKRERRRLLADRPAPTTWEEVSRLAKEIAVVASRYEARGRRGFFARSVMVGRFVLQPWRVFLALHYWANVAHYSRSLHAQFRPAARLMLIGHTHRAGVWTLPGLTLVNTGSYQPLSRALVVQLDETRARVLTVVQSRTGFTLGRELHHAHFSGEGAETIDSTNGRRS